MRKVGMLTGGGLAVVLFSSGGVAFAVDCGHDVHGSPTIEVTELGENTSVIHYFSPATLILDDVTDPRHRAFGECRGQGIVIDGVGKWAGACIWTTADGDSWVAHWTSNPGDKGTEKRDVLHGTARGSGKGKLTSLGRRTSNWSGLANGGSYFCED